jgi:hypothetical protein
MYSLELTDGQAKALQADLNRKYPLEPNTPPQPPQKDPEPEPKPEPIKSDARLVSFASVWRIKQKSGTLTKKKDPYYFKTAGGIAIPAVIYPGERIRINATETTSGGGIPEMSIARNPDVYGERALDNGKGTADNAQYRNRESRAMRVFINVRIANFERVARPASQLIFSQR